jgi:hypothetical protein
MRGPSTQRLRVCILAGAATVLATGAAIGGPGARGAPGAAPASTVRGSLGSPALRNVSIAQVSFRATSRRPAVRVSSPRVPPPGVTVVTGIGGLARRPGRYVALVAVVRRESGSSSGARAAQAPTVSYTVGGAATGARRSTARNVLGAGDSARGFCRETARAVRARSLRLRARRLGGPVPGFTTAEVLAAVLGECANSTYPRRADFLFTVNPPQEEPPGTGSLTITRTGLPGEWRNTMRFSVKTKSIHVDSPDPFVFTSGTSPAGGECQLIQAGKRYICRPGPGTDGSFPAETDLVFNLTADGEVPSGTELPFSAFRFDSASTAINGVGVFP